MKYILACVVVACLAAIAVMRQPASCCSCDPCTCVECKCEK